MDGVDPPDPFAHAPGNVLPGIEVDVPVPKDQPLGFVFHPVDDLANLILQVHQPVHFPVDFLLPLPDFLDGPDEGSFRGPVGVVAFFQPGC